MKHRFLKAGAAAAAAVALVALAPSVANATTLYDNNNYSVFLWSGSSSPGGLPVSTNDRASSVLNVCVEVYCENATCSGRTLSWTGNANSLGGISTGLGLGETWSDRISAVQ